MLKEVEQLARERQLATKRLEDDIFSRASGNDRVSDVQQIRGPVVDRSQMTEGETVG